MDAGSFDLQHGYSYSTSLEIRAENSSLLHHSELVEIECILCSRTYIPLVEENDHLASMTICRDCKSLVMYDDGNSLTARNSLRRQSRRSRYGSSESVETAFSQQFSQLVGLARHGLALPPDDDDAATATAVHRHPRHRNRSRQTQRTRSDTDNDSVGHIDSVFGESDSLSHFNFGGYVGDSDASFDVRSFLETETISPLDNESHTLTDTDIDPMHAGLDHWVSDDQDDEYGLRSPARHVDVFTDQDETDASPFTGTSGDYMDAQGFEDLLEQLADADSSRRGATPAAASSIDGLPCVVISKEHESNGPLFCAVCKDPLSIDAEASQLPCSHLYHPSCILPWLRTRNSCPLCRRELRTDEADPRSGVDETQLEEARDEGYSDEASETGVEEEASEPNPIGGGQADLGPVGQGGGWILMSAAPILSIIGIAIAIWFRSSMVGGRIRGDGGGRRSHGSIGKHGEIRSRWWSPF